MASYLSIAVVLLSLLASASAAAFKDQPAVTIFTPNQGARLPIGSLVKTGISWSQPGAIKYTDIQVSLVKGDAFVNTLVQDICGKGGKPECPPIEPPSGAVGTINVDWVLAPEDLSFRGTATILVRAKWDDINSPGVVDTLSQTLTILVVDATPTPTKKFAPTKTKSPTGTKAPTGTPKPPTGTPKPPTGTPKPPTGTPKPPTATPKAPTATPTKKAAPTQTGKPHATPPCQAGCPPGTFCCNMDCVPGDPATHYCCETGDYPYSCLREVENCCGYTCCAKGLECCGHGLVQVCCPAGTVCQGALCVSAKR